MYIRLLSSHLFYQFHSILPLFNPFSILSSLPFHLISFQLSLLFFSPLLSSFLSLFSGIRNDSHMSTERSSSLIEKVSQHFEEGVRAITRARDERSMGVPARGSEDICLPNLLLLGGSNQTTQTTATSSSSATASSSSPSSSSATPQHEGGPIYFGIDCRSERERQLGSFPKAYAIDPSAVSMTGGWVGVGGFPPPPPLLVCLPSGFPFVFVCLLFDTLYSNPCH